MIETTSYHLFTTNLLMTFAFFCLTMSIVSIWIKKTLWFWGSFLGLSLVFAVLSGVVDYRTLIAIGLLAFLVWLFTYLKGFGRAIVCVLVLLLSLGFWTHKIPGVTNWNLSEAVLGQGSMSYKLWFNYDKPISAIFLLAWVVPTLRSAVEWKRVMKQSILLIVGGIVVMILLGVYGGIVKWDPKLPKMSLMFLWANLFFVSIPEEVLMRGFLQRELCRIWKDTITGQVMSVIIVAALFASLHFFWIQQPFFLALVFLAGLVYGGIYQYTKSIEASIACHYLFNFVHFFLFSYPMLKG